MAVIVFGRFSRSSLNYPRRGAYVKSQAFTKSVSTLASFDEMGKRPSVFGKQSRKRRVSFEHLKDGVVKTARRSC